MTHCAPPLRDMLFTMKELGGLDAVLAQPGLVKHRLGADSFVAAPACVNAPQATLS